MEEEERLLISGGVPFSLTSVEGNKSQFDTSSHLFSSQWIMNLLQILPIRTHFDLQLLLILLPPPPLEQWASLTARLFASPIPSFPQEWEGGCMYLLI